MSLIIENNIPLKQNNTSPALNRNSNNKMTSENRDMKKKASVVRRTKKSINNQFRHSVHEITNGIDELNTNDEQHVRLRRSRSFHATSEEHTHIHQRNRSEILRQYVANRFEIDVDNLDSLENIAEIKYDPTDGTFPLHDAIENYSIKDVAVYLLRNENINVEQTNNFGQTPLLFAVYLGLFDVVKLLIASGSIVNCKDNYGVSALRHAVEGGDFEMASLLISNGANAAAVQNGF